MPTFLFSPFLWDQGAAFLSLLSLTYATDHNNRPYTNIACIVYSKPPKAKQCLHIVTRITANSTVREIGYFYGRFWCNLHLILALGHSRVLHFRFHRIHCHVRPIAFLIISHLTSPCSHNNPFAMLIIFHVHLHTRVATSLLLPLLCFTNTTSQRQTALCTIFRCMPLCTSGSLQQLLWPSPTSREPYVLHVTIASKSAIVQ